MDHVNEVTGQTHPLKGKKLETENKVNHHDSDSHNSSFNTSQTLNDYHRLMKLMRSPLMT